MPAATSGGGRQNVIVLFAIDESGIVSGTSSTYAGTWSVWPAAERFSTQYAPCVAVPVHAVAAVPSATVAPANEIVVVALAATMLPFSGSGRVGEIGGDGGRGDRADDLAFRLGEQRRVVDRDEEGQRRKRVVARLLRVGDDGRLGGGRRREQRRDACDRRARKPTGRPLRCGEKAEAAHSP